MQSLLEPLFSMGMQGAATWLYYDTPDASLRKRLFGTLLLVLLTRAVPLAALAFVVGPWLWGAAVPRRAVRAVRGPHGRSRLQIVGAA